MRMNFKIIFVILIIALVLNILIIRINDLKVASGRGIVTSFVWDKKLADNVENGIRVEIYGPNYVDRSSKLQTYQIRLSQSIYKNENWIMLSSMKVKVKAPHNKGKGLWVRKSNAKALFFEKYLIGEPFVFGMYNSGEAYWEIDTLFSAPTFYKERNENNDISLEMYMLPIAGIGEYLCEGKVYVEITFYDVLNRIVHKKKL